jgi:membrane protease YdiL (CAAX protease family)
MMVVIAVFGWMFGALALWRRSLLPGMLAHGLQDGVSGAIGFFMHH